jgi:Ca-activated chloride channel family protein
MPMRRFGFFQVPLLAAGLIASALPGVRSAEFANLELLLAVDVSASVDAREYSLQMLGLAAAFRDPDLIAAIRASAPKGVAVALMLWAGPSEQTYAVPWSFITDQSTASAFAARLSAVPRPPTSGGTAIGDALLAGISLVTGNTNGAARRVIDVSGDGRNNQGTLPGPIRDYAVSMGLTVNALAIVNSEPNLVEYYTDFVIGGPGSFVLPAADFDDFARAIRLKLIREIEESPLAGIPPDGERSLAAR